MKWLYQGPVHLDRKTLYTVFVVLQCIVLLLPTTNASCNDHVKKYCDTMMCQQQFMSKILDMHDACEDLRMEMTDSCDVGCENAITDLRKAYNGSEGLFTCNCNDTYMFYTKQDCELDRRRLPLCQNTPCVAQSQECETDRGCKARLDAYLETCNPDQTDPEIEPCSEECVSTLDALYAEPLAQNLWECSCDDDETPKKWCRTSPSTYQVLCDMQSQLMSTSRSPQVPYKPLTTKAPTTSPASKDKNDGKKEQQQGSANDGDEPGSTAPSINSQTIYQIVLVALLFTLRHLH